MTQSRPHRSRSSADAAALPATRDARAENSRADRAVARSGIAVDDALNRPELRRPGMTAGAVSLAVSITARRRSPRRTARLRRGGDLRPWIRVVYFIRGGEFLKIGTASNITKRFEGIQAASPVKLQLVGMIHGGVNVEHWCHFHCSHHRSHYEWFRWNGWTKSFIDWVLAHGDDAATRLCKRQLQADGLLLGKPMRTSGGVRHLPWMAREGDATALRRYKDLATKQAAPLGACGCELCATRPWETWQ
ncbi:MAG: GIY-YIG nuclease family protein [Deltaproteobacteria bacterium]|nr:MAG: GIY-YIG nuclease family protein [Deltaproteobacteria bacterium]TMQ03630.1 MAG: GIY-YIG nuclease family protein [Deltaproteobacteria bacterium]